MKSIFFLLGLTVLGHAGSVEAGKAALTFLEKVRAGKVDLEPGGDTALTAQTEPQKKDQIAKRLERMAEDLGKWPLEVGPVELDGSFAAVLVRKTGGFDPSRMQVFSVAMVKRGEEWLAAPVPSSFENAGAGYAIALRKRLNNLEDWMLREQVLELLRLREQSTAEIRQKIEVSLAKKDLLGYDAKQVVSHFLTACEKQDLAAVLGFLGGLETTLPRDWPERLKAADQALALGATAAQPWRLLTAPEVVRLAISEEQSQKRAVFAIACLDPAGDDRKTPRVPTFDWIRMELVKTTGGLWQVNLPENFVKPAGETKVTEEGDSGTALPDAFVETWRAAFPAVPHASALLARQAFIDALEKGDMRALLGLVNLPTEPAEAVMICKEVARVSGLLHAPGAVSQAMVLDSKVGETAAAAMFQLFDAREVDRFQPQTYFFENLTTGWLWNPSPSSALGVEFKPWQEEQSTQWAVKWQEAFFTETVVLGKIPDGPPVGEEEARASVQAWLRAISQKDLSAAMRLAVRLEDQASGALALRNLGYEIASSRQSDLVPEITGIFQGEFWTLVGVKNQHAGKAAYPLYPVIQTPRGPRILAEVDLFAAGNRGREFLNRTAIKRLTNLASEAAIGELSKLYSQYQEATLDRARP